MHAPTLEGALDMLAFLCYIVAEGQNPEMWISPLKKNLDYIIILEFTQNQGHPPTSLKD